MYEGISVRKRSWPAVSQICNRMVRSSKYLQRKRLDNGNYCWFSGGWNSTSCAHQTRANTHTNTQTDRENQRERERETHTGVHGFGAEVNANCAKVVLFKGLIHEAREQRCFPHALVPENHDFVLGQRGHLRRSVRVGACRCVGCCCFRHLWYSQLLPTTPLTTQVLCVKSERKPRDEKKKKTKKIEKIMLPPSLSR